MELQHTQKRQLQRLMESEDWGAVEAFMEDFMLRHFAQDSVKRQNEFETIWQAAEVEGGRRILIQFMNELEDEVRSLKDN